MRDRSGKPKDSKSNFIGDTDLPDVKLVQSADETFLHIFWSRSPGLTALGGTASFEASRVAVASMR